MDDSKIIMLPREDGVTVSEQTQAMLRDGVQDLVEILMGFPFALQAALVDSLAVSWCMQAENPQGAWDALSAAIGRDLVAAQALSG